MQGFVFLLFPFLLFPEPEHARPDGAPDTDSATARKEEVVVWLGLEVFGHHNTDRATHAKHVGHTGLGP